MSCHSWDLANPTKENKNKKKQKFVFIFVQFLSEFATN